MHRWIPTLLTVAMFVPSGLAADEPKRADVIVYCGTAGGVIAAVAAAREGKTVVLVEPGKHIGGMVSGGLGASDIGKAETIGGYSREFFNRVRDYYVKRYSEKSEQARDSLNGFHFEPHVANEIFRQMLAEAKVQVCYGELLDKAVMKDKRIDHLQTATGHLFAGQVYIDASYEGDLLAQAGVAYTIGREGREQYNESLAGVQEHSPAHQWPFAVSAIDAQCKLLPFVQDGALAKPGAGDKKIQAYNYRLCLTDRADNLVPIAKPARYDADRYELLAQYLAKKQDLKLGQILSVIRVPNGKTDINNNGPFSTDHIGANWDYPNGNEKTRERIRQDHRQYTQGFLYFLGHDSRVPEPLRKEMQGWGLAKNEFADSANWPHQPYVREARRMIGAYVMTQADIMDNRTKSDSVGLGSYNTDSHHVQRIATKGGAVLNEGDFQVPVKPYAIPYRSLVPKADECENLLVPVCVSASHVAYGSIRMEPVYMILGHASGVAAALAVEEKTSVQKVSVEKLQAKLKAHKARLSPELEK